MLCQLSYLGKNYNLYYNTNYSLFCKANYKLAERPTPYFAKMKICKLCKKESGINEYKGRNRCGSCNTKIRRFRAKVAAINILGGKCIRCGWQGNQAALQFHHLKNKDFTIGNVANKSWDSIKTEVKKCILLCANCHSIEHNTKLGKEFLKEASNYKGRILNT